MELPKEEKRGVPSYMVSFGDMITLLLTFFILLVAMADTQDAGLVGVGRGPLIQHLNAKGQPGIMHGRLHHDRLDYKRDLWWIQSQEGSPDQLEQVTERLREELQVRFKPNEAQLDYQRDNITLRLPIRVHHLDGYAELDPDARAMLTIVAEAMRGKPERRVRISGDVPAGSGLGMELLESATQGRLVFNELVWQGVQPQRISLWGWGATRPKLPSTPRDPQNLGVTIEVIELPTAQQDRRRDHAR